MANESKTAPADEAYLQSGRVYAMAAICLGVGVGFGFLFRTAAATPDAPHPAPIAAVSSPHTGASTAAGRMPSLAEMHQIASQQVAPLLEKLSKDPDNPALLMQIGGVYHAAHQFRDAAAYYGKAVRAAPKNVEAHTKLATSLYRTGDVDGAVAELNRALALDPKDPNSLFNLGMIELQGKQNPRGAVAAWQKLLRLNPQLDAGRKAQVQQLIASATEAANGSGPVKGADANDRP